MSCTDFNTASILGSRGWPTGAERTGLDTASAIPRRAPLATIASAGPRPCPGSARRGRGRKRPIDLGDGKRVSVDDNVQAHENHGCGRAPHFGPYLLSFAPDGQIRGLPVQPLLQKYSCSLLTQITCICITVSSLWRGGSRSSRTRGGMRWTRMAPITNGA